MLSFIDAAHDFGTLVQGTSATVILTVTNVGGADSGTLSVMLTGADAGQFSVMSTSCTGTLAPNASCTATVRFTPSGVGMFTAALEVMAGPGGVATADLTGTSVTPGNLVLMPVAGNSPNYGGLLLGASKTQSFTVTNSGQQATGPLTITLNGSSSYTLDANGCVSGMTLAGNASCTVTVTFAPAARGPASTQLTVSATPGGSVGQLLTGVGQAPASLTQNVSHLFPDAEVGTDSTSYDWQITNTGDVSTGTLTLGSDPQLSVVANTCTGTLAPSMSCTVSVAFRPSQPGMRSASLNLSGSPGGSVTLNATGTGAWRLTLTRNGPGGAVSTNDGRITDCTSTCSALYAPGAAVVVRARTSNGSGVHFSQWTSPASCSEFGHGYDCSLTITNSVAAAATFSSTTYNLVFTTSTTYPANLGGTAPYDAACNTVATNAGINNTAGDAFVAWLSTSGSPVTSMSRLGTGKGGFTRMDDRPIAVNEAVLLQGQVLNQLNLDETGKTFTLNPASARTWTGTATNGTALTNTCSNWTSTAGFGYAGDVLGGPGRWTDSTPSYEACTSAFHLSCFQRTATGTITLPSVPPGGKVAYLTSASFSLGGGRAAADTFCANNKPAGFTSRTFVAFLGVTGSPASNRITNDSANYYRPDGVFIASGANLKNGALSSGLWQKQDLSYPTTHTAVWTGMWNGPSSALTDADTCTSWTDNVTTSFISGGCANWGTFPLTLFNGCGTACNGAFPLYCIEP